MPVHLCTRALSNGHRCQQPALRDREVCRHHARLHKIRRRSTHQMTMDRLRAEAGKFDLTELLYQFHGRMHRIQSSVEGYPEARAILSLIIERLNRMQRVTEEMEDFARTQVELAL